MSVENKTSLDQATAALDQVIAAAAEAGAGALIAAAQTSLLSEEGLRAIYQRIERFLPVFEGGPWEEPARLAPPLVAGGLRAPGPTGVVEILSELRMLALATGKLDADKATRSMARHFLHQVMALNLDLLFPGDSEEDRVAGGPNRDAVFQLFSLLAEELGVAAVRREVLDEMEMVAAQRPILTDRLRKIVTYAEKIPRTAFWKRKPKRLREFAAALSGPTPLSAGKDPEAYRAAITGRWSGLEREARDFASSMWKTGLVSPQHAVFAQEQRREPELLAQSLGLDERGWLQLSRHHQLASELIEIAVHPGTAQCLYGFARVLERGLLASQQVSAGLERLMSLTYQTTLKEQLKSRQPDVSPNGTLVAGTLAVLGQPLGVGQGNNPTCQSARGISLWAEHSPDTLLTLLIAAARDGAVQCNFEGVALNSALLVRGVAASIDLELDPVSIAVVPHLDKIYDEMMRRAAGRAADGHQWVNPAFYGRWVPTGFAASVTNTTPGRVLDFPGFVRRLYATHHPRYNAGFRLMYPNPVGIFVTSSNGVFLGAHAVSLLQVAEDPQGELRAYFFNPNNEGRQDWGFGVRPSVAGHGEEPGESSLPFHQFASRLYAFHYDPGEVGDEAAIPEEDVAEVEQAARASWGQAFAWL